MEVSETSQVQITLDMREARLLHDHLKLFVGSRPVFVLNLEDSLNAIVRPRIGG